MNRRAFLRLLATGVVGYELDVDKLLWQPGVKTIFIPKPGLTESQIIAIEMERILPNIKSLFDRSDTFYKLINKEKL